MNATRLLNGARRFTTTTTVRKKMSRQARVSQQIAAAKSLAEVDVLGLGVDNRAYQVESTIRNSDLPLHSFDVVTSSTALHRLARYSSTSTDLLQPTVDRLAQLLEGVCGPSGRVMSNALWSCARLSDCVDLSQLLNVVTSAILSLPFDAFESLHIANCLWACATLSDSVQDPGQLLSVVSHLTEALVSRSPTAFSEQNVSNILWSLGALESVRLPPSILLHMAALAQHHLTKGTAGTQSQANGVWGLAKLLQTAEEQDSITDIENQQVRRVVENVALQRISLWSANGAHVRPEELGMVVWSLAATLNGAVDPHHKSLMKLSALIRSKAEALVAADNGGDGRLISNILWSFASLRYWDENLDHFLLAAKSLLTSSKIRLSCRNACASVWALAVLDLPVFPGLLHSAINSCFSTSPEPRAVVALMIGIAASTKRPSLPAEQLHRLFDRARDALTEEHLAPTVASQLFTVQMWGMSCLSRPYYWPEAILRMSVEAGVHGLPSDGRIVSDMQSGVGDALQRLLKGRTKLLVEPTARRIGWNVDFGLGGELGVEWIAT
ncbi:hypothetical protein FOL47_010549 [Perkinsus chesapeaki]|uniref:Uncharacterized protein n=1 Tax=Perkinsus chesapeaki TaxID=330153 RepID=A0A7J6L1E5_PERCH|nr:hypothetical protein FOL47_010549 [Perkinsus chesapeaki]